MPDAAWRPSAIVLDVDGTLYHQAPVRRAMLLRLAIATARAPRSGVRAIRAVAAYRWAQEAAREAAVRVGEDAAARQLRLAAARCGLPPAELSSTVARWMEREPLTLLARHRHAGLTDFLDACRAHGVRLAVLSDYPCTDKIAALGLDGRFDVILSAFDPEVGVFKPDPRGITVALQRLGVDAGEALYVGDRPEVDAAAARAAGVRAAIVGGGDAPPGAEWDAVPDYATLRQRLFG